MKNGKRFPVIPVAAFAILFAVGSYLAFRGPKNDDENPYQYDISGYKTVPEGMLKWSEQAPIQLKSDHIPQALVARKDGSLVIGFDDGLRVVEADGTIVSFGFEQSIYCFAISSVGHLYAGTERGVVQFSEGMKPMPQTDLGEQARITSMVWFKDHLYVADFGQRRVWRLDEKGTPNKQYTGPDGILSLPSPYFDVAANSEGVWVVDPGRHKLHLLSDDFVEVKNIGKTGMGPDGFSGCCNPTHIAMQADGSIVTLEKGLPRVRIFEVDGTLREFVTNTESLSPTMPATDLAVLPDGRIAVLDPFKKQVRLFKRNQPGAINGQ